MASVAPTQPAQSAPQGDPVAPVPSSVLQKEYSLFFSYKGRIGRLKYFLWGLLLQIIFFGVAISMEIFGLPLVFWGALYGASHSATNLGPALLLTDFGVIFAVALLYALMMITLIVKRFHDLNKSGSWFWAYGLIPVWNIYLGLSLLLERGTVGPNQYGDDPLPLNANQSDVLDRIGKSFLWKTVVIIAATAILVGVGAILSMTSSRSSPPSVSLELTPFSGNPQDNNTSTASAGIKSVQPTTTSAGISPSPSSPASAPAISFTSPTSADIWSASAKTQYEIAWTYQGLNANDREQLYLYFPDGTRCNFENGPVSPGGSDYAYVILPSIGCVGSTQKPALTPGMYSVVIVVQDANDNVIISRQSDRFYIGR